jgi:hypothetical protein
MQHGGATSEETAKTPKELKLDERWLKMSANTIIPSGVVATKDRRYYLISARSEDKRLITTLSEKPFLKYEKLF